jgi:hypothetical protein
MEDYMGRIDRIAKRLVGYNANDVKELLENISGNMSRSVAGMNRAIEALERDDLNKAWQEIGKLPSASKAFIPDSVIEWLEKNVGKSPVKEVWKAGISRDIEAVFGGGRPVEWVYQSFLTYTDGTSNKFHMFAVVEVSMPGGRTEYVGGNAYGRIGARAKVIEIARGSQGSVMSVVYDKERQKENKGYRRQ